MRGLQSCFVLNYECRHTGGSSGGGGTQAQPGASRPDAQDAQRLAAEHYRAPTATFEANGCHHAAQQLVIPGRQEWAPGRPAGQFLYNVLSTSSCAKALPPMSDPANPAGTAGGARARKWWPPENEGPAATIVD